MEEHYGFIHILVNGKYHGHLSQFKVQMYQRKLNNNISNIGTER